MLTEPLHAYSYLKLLINASFTITKMCIVVFFIVTRAIESVKAVMCLTKRFTALIIQSKTAKIIHSPA